MLGLLAWAFGSGKLGWFIPLFLDLVISFGEVHLRAGPCQPFFLVLPKPLKPIRRQGRLASGGLNFCVPGSAQGFDVVAVVGELVASAMPQHVRMNREW